MTQKRRVRLSANQRTDMWQRWKAGSKFRCQNHVLSTQFRLDWGVQLFKSLRNRLGKGFSGGGPTHYLSAERLVNLR